MGTLWKSLKWLIANAFSFSSNIFQFASILKVFLLFLNASVFWKLPSIDRILVISANHAATANLLLIPCFVWTYTKQK